MNISFSAGYDSTQNLVKSDRPIVIIDDDTDFHFIARKCYGRSGKDNELITFENGESALSYLKNYAFSEDKFPEVIFVDINMPGMSGFEVVSEVKKIKQFGNTTYIFMLTNSESPYDIESARKCGASGYLTKVGSIKTYIDFFRNL
ncbi:MAG: response regulator [Bdellovibrionales bacterium]|nr:response regulator [Bdellovibrionales bacterium]